MLIKVKRHHITNGRRNSALHCPIALACRDAGMIVPTVNEVDVSYLTSAYGIRRSHLPQTVSLKLAAFDRGEGMDPFDFDVNL